MTRPGRMMTTVRLAAALGVGLLVLTGCRWDGVQSMTLPGGAATGGKVYHVRAVFADVMDLVPQSSVRVNDVAVGDVEGISLTPAMRAEVTMRIKASVHLPANSVAVLEQTSLLGEKYVALLPPSGERARGTLRDGATIPALRTSDAATVEEVFGALSALLNGGGVAQLRTISVELGKALDGREGQVRDFLGRLRTFVGGLDAHRAAITRALDALDRLSTTLRQQRGTIATALDDIAPGLKVLADQRGQLVAMLAALSRLGVVATNVIHASKADTVADLRALTPILGKLDQAGTNLPNALELLLDYPFPKTATEAMKGDYTGLRLTLDLDSSLRNLLQQQPGGNPLCPPACLPGSGSGGSGSGSGGSGGGGGSGSGGSGGPLPLPLPTPSLPSLPGASGQPAGGSPSSQSDIGDLGRLLLGGLP